jgi:uncharacterized protein YgiM (DUF1202 family)
LVAFSTTCAAVEQFPYKAYISTEEAFVRSGPGEDYYATDKLRRGDEVEVYRHDPGGWYAIRPPDGSFSWAPARYLQPAEENLAIVVADSVSVRVGSRLSDDRRTAQVRLRKGEVVELLEPEALSAKGVPPAWCKIAPPAGEFRWVHSSQLARQPPTAVVPALVATSTGGSAQGQQASAAGAQGNLQTAAQRDKPSAEDFQRELECIEIELSVMVVEEPAVWSLDALLQRAEKLLQQADNPLDRGRAQVLVNRINRFADIKQQYDRLAAMRDNRPEVQQLTVSRAVPADTPGALRAAGRFDAVGRLAEVPARKPGAPRYALLDDHDRVRCYVTPAPGVSLRAYVGKYVGINGTRGYVPEQRAAHLMARQVRVVEGSNWR